MRNEAEVMGLRFAFLFMARVRQLHLSFLMLLFIGCYLLQHRAYFHRTEKNHSRSGTENAVAERERERQLSLLWQIIIKCKHMLFVF